MAAPEGVRFRPFSVCTTMFFSVCELSPITVRASPTSILVGGLQQNDSYQFLAATVQVSRYACPWAPFGGLLGLCVRGFVSDSSRLGRVTECSDSVHM